MKGKKGTFLITSQQKIWKKSVLIPAAFLVGTLGWCPPALPTYQRCLEEKNDLWVYCAKRGLELELNPHEALNLISQVTDESTRSRRVAIAEGEPETFYLKWANLSHKYKFFTLILGCIFLAATIGPFLSAALYTASGDLAVMPSFALTRQRGLASKLSQSLSFFFKTSTLNCRFIYLTSPGYLDCTEMR